MNRLQYETSPYLLQHASNPVDWYAWKPEAIERAKMDGKPILVSIGYSTCHWCHVMERESFEDHEVAEFMNEHFVCIKVDREERPDVDQIYMEACQVMTGGGGWPLNCFLLPDGRPFYAGTYYPPVPNYNRPSWLQVLMNLSHAYQNKQEAIEDQAQRLTDIIKDSGKTFTGGNKLRVVTDEKPFSPELLKKVYANLQRQFDAANGGFGGAPKFPGTMSLHYLLAYHFHFGEKSALDHVMLSLDKMAMGGIYDQLGGGFARYATDSKWLVPHFEKMLYDNALLVGILADAYKLTKKELYKETIEETLAWVKREMTSPEGGFFSAQDADSEGEEGKFYVWDAEEVQQVLGEDFELFSKFYDVTQKGNWEEKNIIWRKIDFEEFANEAGLELVELKNRLFICRQKLLEVRNRRIWPSLDDKHLLDWNALMCSAYASAYSALGVEAYREAAVVNMNFMLEKFKQSDGVALFHTYKNGQAQYDAFLDDYAYLIDALLNVAEITAKHDYVLQAGRYIEFDFEHFLDLVDKMFYFTSAQQKDVLLRRKDLYDSATPSGNSIMVRNLQRAGLLLGREDWAQHASEMLLTIRDSIERYPSSFSQWASSTMGEVFGLAEVAVVGEQALNFAKGINAGYLPNKVLMASVTGDENFPMLKDRPSEGHTLVYLCENYTCQRPVDTIEAFRQLFFRTRVIGETVS
ncbi:MAG: thioredoxin domain-containing protein [Saprospiraceae bacterium]|nr:thioredoxin domain-containing protein [Saprospiraceae bacterium]